MVKIAKYSKKNLLKYLNVLDKKIYLFFYDLKCEKFADTIYKLSRYLNIIEVRNIEVHNERCLMVFSYKNYQGLEDLVAEIDTMDIGELDISEYSNNQEVIGTTYASFTDNNHYKKIYVNKDEMIIQLYNFY